MFNIDKFPEIINHLKDISPSMFKDVKNEFMIHCPYCNDSKREKASNHGHLYIAKDKPVFHCHLCNCDGTILKLLIDTGFTDKDCIDLLKNFVKYNFTSKDLYFIKHEKKIDFNKEAEKRILEFMKDNKNEYDIFSEYIYERTGIKDFCEFFILPKILNENLICEFYDSYGKCVVKRTVGSDSRYFDNKGKYFFQELDFAAKNRIVVAEGPFDIINMYLYTPQFKNCVFISINGKNYRRNIENLILSDLLVGTFEINLVFDNDNRNYNYDLFGIRRNSKILNRDITVKGWLPIIGKDTGDYPVVKEIS